MYNWVDGRKSSTFSCISKDCSPFIRSKLNLLNFNHLPVIKEEGCFSDQELKLPQKIQKLQHIFLKTNHERGNSVSTNDSFQQLEKIKYAKSYLVLPPLLNVNCLMNTELKQTLAIWDTNFGRRLIKSKNLDENQNDTKIKTIVERKSKKFGDYQDNIKPPKQKSVEEHNRRNGEGDKVDLRKFKSNKKKTERVSKKDENSLKIKSSTSKKESLKSILDTQSTVKLPETVLIESPSETETISSLSKNQKFLTNHVKHILDNYSGSVNCEYCNKSFPNNEELSKHQNQHNAVKEICLLCGRIFYNSNDFVKHLLRHEGVDRFSCKKCKKYFPNSRKYKQHCKDFHGRPSHYSLRKVEPIAEKWLPKSEYKTNTFEFDLEKDQCHNRNPM